MAFTVTTWNVENFSSGSQNFETKTEQLAAKLRGLDPDVVALQEVLNDAAAQALADALGYRSTVAEPDGRGHGGGSPGRKIA